MSGAEFHVRVEGEDELERELAGIQARLGDLTPLMDTIGAIGVSDVHDNFEGEHSPEGVPWKPSQRALRDGGKTLQLSRRMAQSVTHNAGPSSVEIGTKVVYARRHQEGFHGPEQVSSFSRVMRTVFGVRLAEPIEVVVGAFTRVANTVARPFLGLSTDARAEILDVAGDYALGGAA